MKEFNKEVLETFLPESFKGLSKQYVLDAIFNNEIQKNWKPQIGDIIVGSTGNVFVISGDHDLVPELGGKMFFFGGGLCNRDGGNIMNETYCYTMNKSGNSYEYDINLKIKRVMKKFNHSSFKDFRFVPYPHELKKQS